jgi:hypothetical protein
VDILVAKRGKTNKEKEGDHVKGESREETQICKSKLTLSFYLSRFQLFGMVLKAFGACFVSNYAKNKFDRNELELAKVWKGWRRTQKFGRGFSRSISNER